MANTAPAVVVHRLAPAQAVLHATVANTLPAVVVPAVGSAQAARRTVALANTLPAVVVHRLAPAQAVLHAAMASTDTAVAGSTPALACHAVHVLLAKSALAAAGWTAASAGPASQGESCKLWCHGYIECIRSGEEEEVCG